MARTGIEGERSAAALQVSGAVSAQIGAAVGASAFPIAGPAAVVAVRQAFAAIVFLIIARPPVHRMRWTQLWPPLVLAAALVVMNLSVYFAIERLGLGLAVTLEFLGPLAVALVASRGAVDALLAVGAFGGVIMLTGTVPGIDPIGIAFALSGALGWAGYIVFSQVAGRRLPGFQASAIALTVASICTMPILIVSLLGLEPAAGLTLIGIGIAASILSTLLPNAIDMTVLRRLRREVFGILQSAQPALAALVGFVALGQVLSWWQLAGLALICAINALAVVVAARPRPARQPSDPATSPIPVYGAGDG
jgi:inner membrane transporter RhtA